MDTQLQLVVRNTDTDYDVALEPIQIPLPTKRAISHWQSLARANTNATTTTSTDATTASGQWWEGMTSQPAELKLSNGVFTGRMIDFDGTNVEIFRGKLKQEKLS